MQRKSLIVLGILVAVTGWTTAGIVWAQRGKVKIKEIQSGSVPTEYGELVSVSGDANSTTLAFRRENNDIVLVRMRGTKIPNQVLVVSRSTE